MSLRPTRRRSGTMHATIKVSFHPGRSTMLDILAYDFWPDWSTEPTPTKAAVEKAVRAWYNSHGGETELSVGDSLAEMDDDEREQATEWAEEQLMRLWPEWVK